MKTQIVHIIAVVRILKELPRLVLWQIQPHYGPFNYHVVFDKPMRYWSDVLRVISWIGILADNPNVWKWVCMQAIKKACTLRVSEKPTKNGVKPKPRIVYRYGRQNQQIKVFLEKRKEIWNILKKIRKINNP